MYVIKIGEPSKEGANRGVFLCNGKIVHFACNKWSTGMDKSFLDLVVHWATTVFRLVAQL